MKANPEIVVNVNMSLRDYFAAKAMQGLVSAHNQEGMRRRDFKQNYVRNRLCNSRCND
jgi:hypothetical protein